MDNKDKFYDEETREWLEALDDIVQSEGPEKASFILSKLAERLTQKGTPSRNSLLPSSLYGYVESHSFG